MRKRVIPPVWFMVLSLTLFFGGLVWCIRKANAQTVPTTLQLTGSAPHTTCAVVASTTNYCFANDGLWQSINGAPYVQLTPGGVVSFNGRTGAVVPVSNDYSYSQLSNPPTSINCAGTGCVIK